MQLVYANLPFVSRNFVASRAALHSISLRENERGAQIFGGWDPQHHQPTDVYTTYYETDFLLGLNATQTTLAAIAQLGGATLKK